MIIEYHCPFGQPSGIARAAHDYMMALRSAGCDVRPVAFAPYSDDRIGRSHKPLLEKTGLSIAPPDVVIVHGMPSIASSMRPTRMKQRRDSLYVFVTTWETSALPPHLWVQIADNYDAIVVPSRDSREAMMADLRPPGPSVHVVPHAFDPAYWIRDRKPSESATYHFYTIGVWSTRKNIEGVITAYFVSFQKGDPVRLTILTPWYDEERIEAIKRATGFDNFPEVRFITQRVTDEELYSLHERSDCYVSASRGEGWGLGSFEAALVGNAIITTPMGARDFLEHYDGYHRTFGGIPTPAMAYEHTRTQRIHVGDQVLSAREIRSARPEGVDALQTWMEPDLTALSYEMHNAYNKRAGFRPGRFGGALIREYGYEAVGSKFLSTLSEIAGKNGGVGAQSTGTSNS
ncbi:MAG: glycosyltransferase family 4 protein [Kiloniellales bacterium]|nr:glycosyltransferase family 4 protein [Kiloniellales bacterium]